MSEFSQYAPGILLAYTAFFLAIMSPGPNIMAIIGTSMSVGRREGIALAVGVSLGSFCWALLTALGLSAILVTYSAAVTVIKIAGGLYLLYLAYKSLRSAASRYDIEAKTLSGETQMFGFFRRGFTIQMTNPKAALAWIAIISLGLTENSPWWVGFVIVLGTTILSLVFYYVYAVIFSTAVMVRAYNRARRLIQATLGSFFTFAGITMLVSRN